jgi:hypothetical protein
MPTAERSQSLPHEASLALAIIVFHFVVGVIHGVVHFHYEIPLEMWQHVYIAVVIFAAPLVAGGLLLKRKLRAGAWLLLVSMTGSLVFGVYFHFLLIGPDHISSVGLSDWGLLFLASAIFLAATEAWCVSVSLRLLRVARRLG